MTEDKIEITKDHLTTIREKWDCAEMNDNAVISAMLRYERRIQNGGVCLIEMLCFPDFQSYLNFFKTSNK